MVQTRKRKFHIKEEDLSDLDSDFDLLADDSDGDRGGSESDSVYDEDVKSAKTGKSKSVRVLQK